VTGLFKSCHGGCREANGGNDRNDRIFILVEKENNNKHMGDGLKKLSFQSQ